MRNRIRINNFSGGMNNLISPELLKDNECQYIQNYEYDRSSMLKHRKNISLDSPYYQILEREEITEVLSYVVWYPKYKPSNCGSDEILFFIAKNNTEISCFISYYSIDTQDYVISNLGAGNFSFTENSTPTIFKSYDRLLIADWGSQIRPFELFYDKKNELVIRQLGIKSPNGLIKLQEDKTYYYGLEGQDTSIALIAVDNDFGDVGTGVEAGSALQYVYTVIDIYGNESNPSPISTISYNMQRYIDSTTSTGFKYFYKYIALKGLVVPENFVTAQQKKTLKNYKIYRRDSMFLEGSEIKNFELVAEIPIGSSTFVDTAPYGGEQVSYENDIAPVCKRIIEKDKTIFISSIKSGLGLPYSFGYITPIVVNNINDISYVTPQLKFEFMSSYAILQGLELTWTEIVADRDKLRIYFEDMITPCKVVYSIRENDDLHADLLVEVPYLYSGATHRLFFCYGGQGVTNSNYLSFEYGRFVTTSELTNYDRLFISRMSRFKNEKAIAVGIYRKDNRLMDIVGEDIPDSYALPTNDQIRGFYWSTLNNELIKQKVNNFITPYVYSELLPATTMIYLRSNIRENELKVFYASGRYYIDNSFNITVRTLPLGVSAGYVVIPAPTESYQDFSIAIIYNGEINKGVLRTIADDGTVTHTTLNMGAWWNGQENDIDTFITFDVAQVTHCYISSETKPFGMSDEVWLQIILNQETYFPYANPAGGKYLTIEDTIEEDEYEKGENILRWSYNNTFPELYFKRFTEPIIDIIEAPYFLTTEYGSSILVYTRNTLNRFILKETVTSWADRADNVIQETTQYGLYAPKSLFGNSQMLIHLSEDGLIRWDRLGIRNISKNVIDIPLKDNYIGVFCPLRNQYWLHDDEEKISYIYDIDRENFVIFTGLSLTMSDVLDKGSTLANKNIFIDGTKILEYPNNDIDFTDNSKIVTKKFFIDNRKVIRMKLEHNGETTITGKVFRKSSEIDTTITNIDSGTFRGLQDGSYGDYVSFEISDFDELFALTYETETKV